MHLSTPTVSALLKIPSGSAGIRQTLKTMRILIRDGSKDLVVRTKALSLISHLAQKAYTDEAKALFTYVQSQIRYVRDPVGTEMLHTAGKVMEFGQGDCDDKVILLGALLQSIGHPVRLVAVGKSPNDYCHVYIETRIGPSWVAMETTEPYPFGWKPQKGVASMMIENV